MKRLLLTLSLIACSSASLFAPSSLPLPPLTDISGTYTDSIDTNVQIFTVTPDTVIQGIITQGSTVTLFTATLGHRPGLVRYVGASNANDLVEISVSSGDTVVAYPLWMDRLNSVQSRVTYNRALYRVAP